MPTLIFLDGINDDDDDDDGAKNKRLRFQMCSHIAANSNQINNLRLHVAKAFS